MHWSVTSQTPEKSSATLKLKPKVSIKCNTRLMQETKSGSIKVVSSINFWDLLIQMWNMRVEKNRGEARNHYRKSISEISALYSQVENVQQLQKSFTFSNTFFWTRILGPYRWKERARNSSQTIPWVMLVVVKEALSHYRHAGQQASDRSLPRGFSHIAAVFTRVPQP